MRKPGKPKQRQARTQLGDGNHHFPWRGMQTQRIERPDSYHWNKIETPDLKGLIDLGAGGRDNCKRYYYNPLTGEMLCKYRKENEWYVKYFIDLKTTDTRLVHEAQHGSSPST